MVKWATDYFIKAWNPATKTLYGQVSDGNIDHKFWGRPEDMNQNNRPVNKKKITFTLQFSILNSLQTMFFFCIFFFAK